MGKKSPQRRPASPRRVVLWMGATALLVGGAFWAREHRQAVTPVAAIYQEPGWLPEHKSTRWTCIVIHHSACERGSAETFDQYHRQRGWEGLGYDFVVGNGSESGDGQVQIGFRWARQIQGAHCETDDHYFNEHGIGICLVGNLENHPPGPKQIASMRRLVEFLCDEFGIGPDAIYTHGGITGKTACPGRDFDLLALRASIKIANGGFALPGDNATASVANFHFLQARGKGELSRSAF